MVWLPIAAQLFFGLDPSSMSALQAAAKLKSQNFEQISKPSPPPSGSSTGMLLDGLENETKWIGYKSYDIRLRSKSPQSDVEYIELHPCPATGKLAEVIILYRHVPSIAQFGRWTREITDALAVDPDTNASASGESLSVRWEKAGSPTTVAHWIKGGAPSVHLMGTKESVDCRLSFGAVSDPN